MAHDNAFRSTLPFSRGSVQTRGAVLASGAANAARLGARLLVISGGRPGVGATTLAVKLAETLAADALRVLLVDADLYRADLASQCALAATQGIGDVLLGRKTIHEALQLGPQGIQVLTGLASAEMRDKASDRAIQRFVRQLVTLGPHADWLIVDAGNQPTELAARLWSIAHCVLLVTSPEAVAVMDTYALIKTLISRYQAQQRVSVVVNQSPDDETSLDVHRRIDRSCQRFLNRAIDFVGGLPNLPPGATSTADDYLRFAAAVAQLIDKLATGTGSELAHGLRVAA
jgi:flagellar biosynthesis protein FlhG